MNNFKKIASTKMSNVKGGGRRAKYDTNGDGVWDVKFVFSNDGRLKKVKYNR